MAEKTEKTENKIISISSPFSKPPPVVATKVALKPKKRPWWHFLFASGLLLGLIIAIWYAWQQTIQMKENTLYVAIAGPMTGSAAANGKAMREGVQLYLDQVNKSGGIAGKQLKLLAYDDQNKVDLAKQVAEEIATNSKALAVIGHQTSSATLAAGAVYKKYGIPAITGTATADSITVDNDWYFRIIFTNSDQGALMANYMRKVLNYDSASIIYDEDVFGLSLANAFLQTAKMIGLGIDHQWSFKIDDKKDPAEKKLIASEVIRKMVATLAESEEPKTLFVAIHTEEAIEAVAALKRLNYVQIVGADPFSTSAFMELIGKYPQERTQPGYYTDGIYTTSPFLSDIASEFAQTFRQAFLEQYEEEPAINAAMYYDAAIVAVNGIRNLIESAPTSKSATLAEQREQVKNNLWQLSTFEKSVEGVTGYIYFAQRGDAVKSIPIGIYKNGKPVVALYQFQPLTDLRSVDNLLQEVLDNQIVNVNGKFMRKAQVVYTGIDFNELSELNIRNSTFKADFYLWFRFHGQFDQEDIEFANLADATKNLKPLGKTIVDQVSKVEKNMVIKTYHVKTDFKVNFDFHDFPLDKQILPIKFRHRKLTRDRLIYVTDRLGMKQYQGDTESIVKGFDKKKVFAIGGWKVDQLALFQDTKKNDSNLGVPELFNSQQHIEYSQFNAQIGIQRYLLGFLLKNLVAISFLVVLGYFSFFIPISGFPTRLALGTSLIMTTSLFHLKLSSELANIDYIVLIEYVFYLIYFLAVFVIIVSVYSHAQATNNPAGSKALIAKVNLVGKIVYPLMIATMIAVLFFLYRQVIMG